MEKDENAIEPLLRGLSTLNFWQERKERRNVSITCYQVDKPDCTVRGVLFNYQECTPKKIDKKKQYNGSPMEVEYSENVTNSNTSKSKSSTKTKTEAKKKRSSSRKVLRESINEVFKKDEGSSFQGKIGIVITIMVVLSVLLHFLFYQHATSDNCDCEVNIERLQKHLLEEVYNQTDCVDVMIKSLYNRNRWPQKKKVLVFTGSAGVGKTFVVDIAKRHFPKEGILEILDTDQKIANFHPKLCSNLIVIDNLNVANVGSVITFLNFLPETSYSLIVVVFNVQKTDRDLNYFYDHEAVNTIEQEFATSSLYFESCSFNTLDKLSALVWLKTEISKRRINETLQKNITDYVLGSTNFTQSGFKRLSQKLSIAAEMFKND